MSSVLVMSGYRLVNFQNFIKKDSSAYGFKKGKFYACDFLSDIIASFYMFNEPIFGKITLTSDRDAEIWWDDIKPCNDKLLDSITQFKRFCLRHIRTSRFSPASLGFHFLFP